MGQAGLRCNRMVTLGRAVRLSDHACSDRRENGHPPGGNIGITRIDEFDRPIRATGLHENGNATWLRETACSQDAAHHGRSHLTTMEVFRLRRSAKRVGYIRPS